MSKKKDPQSVNSLGEQWKQARRQASEEAENARKEAEKRDRDRYLESLDSSLKEAERAVRTGMAKGENYITVYTLTSYDAPRGYEETRKKGSYLGVIASRVLQWCEDNDLQTEIRLSLGDHDSDYGYECDGAFIVAFIKP